MKKALIILLIITFGGAALFFVGLPYANANFSICGWGLVIFCVASFLCAIVSGTKLTKFFNWEASSAPTGCILFPFYMLVYPVIGCILCAGGWIFGIKKLTEIWKE